MNKAFFITLLALISSVLLPLSAQQVLQGRVVDNDGHGVEFVNVGVVNASTPYGTTTDARGFFSLNIKSTDSVTVRVSCTGFEAQEHRLKLHQGEKRRLNLTLKSLYTQIGEVTVRDENVRNSTFSQIQLEKIEHLVGPSDGIESLLKTLPDVSSNNELSSQYSVRGGSFDENLVYINDVEVYRPQLIRSGQQEGMSIINPDLVDHLLFSPGGFDATYGDRLSSALDITYSRPIENRNRVSLSFLGGSLASQGRVGERFTYSLGFRHHNNSYIFRSLETDGSYTSSYTDLQGVFSYRFNDSLSLSFLGVWTRNRYGLIPASRTTAFGGVSSESLEMDVYFDGKEEDRYNTLLGSVSLEYHPTDEFQLRWITSAQYNKEQEIFDIQDEYWLYQVNMGESVGDTMRFDRGVGTFLEHARNYLNMGIYATELKAVKYAPLGNWYFGVKGQMEDITDRMREWKWVDSAGYSFPTDHHTPGLDDTVVFSPILQSFCHTDNHIRTLRGMAYIQRELSLFTRQDDQIRILAGARAHYYNTSYTSGQLLNSQLLFSPRLSVNFKPHGEQDILYRVALGVYQQPSLYREMRRTDGSLCVNLPAQCSYQATGTFDWNLKLWERPFRITADLYYKYITDLVPYTIDNLRISYNPDADAVAYAAGLSIRVNGDFVEGLESWASLSLMQTQEKILGDDIGWVSRPTDQRLSFKVFIQDYLPEIPWWRMSLSFLFGSRTPVLFPYQNDRVPRNHLPSYFRVDWGNMVQISRFDRVRHSRIGEWFDDISVGVEVFNLFNYRNVVSYIWVSDYSNQYYAVPNYLTARQINLKITGTF